MSTVCYNIIKENNQSAAAAAESEEIMNTREELAKIANYISGVLQRYQDKDFAFQSGAYQAALEGVKRDLDSINEILELQEKRIYP